MLCKVLAQAGNYVFFGLALYQFILQGKEGRGLHGVKHSGLKVAFLVEELLFQIGPCCFCHLLVLLAVATRSFRHIPHHLCIDQPIAGTQVVPIDDGIGIRLPVLIEGEVDTGFQGLTT